MAVPRMRTVTESLRLIKEQDIDSAVTLNCIRTMCKRGAVKHTLIGKKILVDFDDLITKLSIDSHFDGN